MLSVNNPNVCASTHNVPNHQTNKNYSDTFYLPRAPPYLPLIVFRVVLVLARGLVIKIKLYLCYSCYI